jgi:hypothetical protein
MKHRITFLIAILCAIFVCAWMVQTPRFGWLMNKLQGKKTVGGRLAQYGARARADLGDDFRKAGVPYPPSELVLVGLKQEKELQVYARGKTGGFRHVKIYPILAASGHIGPKLREGDLQVPEGIYRITYLNPNSLYHLSLRLDYPMTSTARWRGGTAARNSAPTS